MEGTKGTLLKLMSRVCCSIPPRLTYNGKSNYMRARSEEMEKSVVAREGTKALLGVRSP